MTAPQPPAPTDGACYRHPDKPSGVSCQRCGRTICGSCMNQASVGFHCPECVKGTGTQRVYNTRNLPGSQGIVTRALVGINVAIFVLSITVLGGNIQSAGSVGAEYGTWGVAIDELGEWWRVISGGFLHSGLIHIGFNMYLLWALGQQLERMLGEVRFGLVYVVSLVGGAFGALLLDPAIPAVGASGAVFGLIGLTVFAYRSRGIGLFDTSLGMLIVLNFLFSFRGGVSLGGHLGGFVVGVLLGILFFGVNPGDGPLLGKDQRTPMILTGVLGALLFGASIWAAGTWESPLFGAVLPGF